MDQVHCFTNTESIPNKVTLGLIRPKQKFLGLRLAFMNVWDTFCKTVDQVHGPGPEKGSMDPCSMFCPYPLVALSLDIPR